jgi:sRNA-binding protein
VAHAATLRALLTQPPAVLPNQVGDPLLPLRIGVWDALLALLRPGAEPEALARALRAYTRSMGYFMACARKDAMRHDLDGRVVEPVSEEHRTGSLREHANPWGLASGRVRLLAHGKRVGWCRS